MSTDLQKVIQRVRLVSPSGVIFKPRRRVLSVVGAIAAHTLHDAPERGICKAASVLGERADNTGRRTVFTATREAASCGLISWASVKPKQGVKFQAPVYYLSPRLVEASATGYKGEWLLFNAPFEPPAKQGGSREAKSKRATVQHRSAKLATQVITAAKVTKVNAPKAPAKSQKKKENKANHCMKTQECNFCTMEVQRIPYPPPLHKNSLGRGIQQGGAAAGLAAGAACPREQMPIPLVAAGGPALEAASALAQGSSAGAGGGLGHGPGSTPAHGCSSSPWGHLVGKHIDPDFWSSLPGQQKRKKKGSQAAARAAEQAAQAAQAEAADANWRREQMRDQIKFFDFLGQKTSVQLDFQTRRKSPDAKTGKRNRGALVWAAAGAGVEYAFCSAQEAPVRILNMLWHLVLIKKKSDLEGVVRVLGEHPILLLDDLDQIQLKKVGEWWQGELAAILTSVSPEGAPNYQAFLKADRPLTSGQRKACQRALVARFGGDDDATDGVQLHRYPGSINHKNGGVFCTRLVAIRTAQGGNVGEQVDELLATKLSPKSRVKSAVQVKPDQQKNQQPQQTKTGVGRVSVDDELDPSRAAFIYALKGLKACVPGDTLASQIADKFNTGGKHTRGRDGGLAWAKRTVESAGVKGYNRSPGWYLSRNSL